VLSLPLSLYPLMFVSVSLSLPAHHTHTCMCVCCPMHSMSQILECALGVPDQLHGAVKRLIVVPLRTQWMLAKRCVEQGSVTIQLAKLNVQNIQNSLLAVFIVGVEKEESLGSAAPIRVKKTVDPQIMEEMDTMFDIFDTLGKGVDDPPRQDIDRCSTVGIDASSADRLQVVDGK
jgi:hypothetical protein